MFILLLLCSYSPAFVYDVYNNEMFKKKRQEEEWGLWWRKNEK